ncbi:hypothetical protein [Tritonibacter horizontis]|uniref:Lipoprotein n=1 Tax=Tritonibacter horizontis TaxID=1768241 RepID=A0A132C3J2_9RHOB|nr:hypothetical protein [Tritonibacter horizontis]KUP95096.1 hypothetical protein TRIHO_00060 [Tritonibacter horizontis]
MRTPILILALCAALAGCAAPQRPDADPETIASVAYRAPDKPSMTLFTMVNNRTGQGGHTALMVNASERVIFDPAGSFYADIVPERQDVLYGITPRIFEAYRSAHARETFHVVTQEIALTPEQAQIAYQLVTGNGRVAGAFCTNATSSILRQIPGFEQIEVTYYPVQLQEQFAQLPGVVTDKYYENDSEDLKAGLAQGNATLNTTAAAGL